MNACGTGKKLGHCLALLTTMRADGVEPTIHTFTVRF
jgi:pentatricopeptide repeat protein